MRDRFRYIGQWLSALMMVLLFTGCSKSSDSDSGGGGEEHKKPALRIYVFPPDQPIVTRADNGNVNVSTEAEKKINNLHVWVFEHNNGKLVGHISLNNVDFSDTQSNQVLMELDDALVSRIENPTEDIYVDVYVAANVTSTNCGITLDASTTRAQLEEKIIDADHFGIKDGKYVNSVPADGLPMSGVMKNKKITGSSPVYQVSEDGGGLANVRLVRAVSKIRYVLSMSTTNPDEVTVNSITLGCLQTETAEEIKVLPTTEYLFLDDAYDLSTTVKYKVGTDYENAKAISTNSDNSPIKRNDSPASYSYVDGMSGQQYETIIQDGINEGKLSDFGTYYLRESDKILTGTIKYTVKHTDAEKNGTSPVPEKTATFAMHKVGDFSRNHTWIVYGYFVSSGNLLLNMVEIKNWSNIESPHDIYNW